MEKSYQRQYCSPLLSHLWNDTHCLKNTVLALVTLVSLACLALGASSLSGAGLNAIGSTGSITMLAVGGISLLAVVIRSYACRGRRVITKEEADRLQSRLLLNEFFVFQEVEKNGVKKMLRIRNSLNALTGFTDYSYYLYDDFKKRHQEVSYRQLAKREKT